MHVSIIVLVWNGARFLDACLTALIAQDYADREIIVVDNDSKDESVAIAKKYTRDIITLRNDYNLGYSAGNNAGIKAARGEVIVLLNQDTVVRPGWLAAIVDPFSKPSVGIVGCKLLYPNSSKFQHAGGYLNSDEALPRHFGWGEEDNGQYDVPIEPDFVTGAAFAMHRRVLEKLGPLDEGFHPAFFEEIDYCYRARRAGFRIVYQPAAVSYHYETTTLPPDSYERASAFQRNRIRFILRNWTVESLRRFADVENAAIQASSSLDDLTAKARGCWDNMLAVPTIALQRERDQTLGGALTRGDAELILHLLQDLRAESHQRIVDLLLSPIAQPIASVADPSPTVADATSDITHLRMDSVATDQSQCDSIKVEGVSALRAPRVNSRVPILGSFIGGFRNLWYSVVLKHYLVPVLDQQSQINDQLRATLEDLVRANQVQAQMVTDQLGSLQRIFEAELESQKLSADREIRLLRAKNDALVCILKILSADQVSVPEATMKLLDEIELRK